MRIPRIYVDGPLAPGGTLSLPEVQGRHVSQVLRLQPGARLTLFNGDGRDYEGRLAGVGRQPAVIVDASGAEEPLPPLEIHLAVGVSKGERMDHVVQKAVELGVVQISPLFTERGVVRLTGERLERRMAHWRGIVIGACEQSGRRRLPRLDQALDLEDWMDRAPRGGLLLDSQGAQALVALRAPGPRLTLLVGPEGGLSPREHRWALNRGLLPVRLGPRVLRTETAPLAAIAAIQTLWGDFCR
jgi:16S rRNA (uracil1498-N3)-methyltransferase